MFRNRPFLSAIIALAAGAFTATVNVVTVASGAVTAYALSAATYVLSHFAPAPSVLTPQRQSANEGWGLGRFMAYALRREARERPHVRDTLRLCA